MKAAIRIPYGQDFVDSVPLLDPASTTGGYLTALPAVIAAGDATVYLANGRLGTGTPGVANLACKILGFDSMDSVPLVGDEIRENGGDGIAFVVGVVLVAGSVGVGTASGFMFVKTVSGTWTDNSTIDNQTRSDTDFATVDAATTDVYTEAGNQIANTAGLFAYALGRAWFGVTAAECSGRACSVRLRDQTATELWVDSQVDYLTEDHPLAGESQGCLYAGTASAIAAGTITFENNDGIGHPLSADVNIAPNLVVYVESASTGAGQAAPLSSMVHATRVGTLLHNWNLTPTGTVVYKVYSIARMPAHVVAKLSTVGLSTQEAADVNTEAVDALNVDTYAEPGQGTPSATTSLAAKINYLYKSWRNRKTQTATVWSLYNDDATTVDHKATVADDGSTASKTEVATGP